MSNPARTDDTPRRRAHLGVLLLLLLTALGFQASAGAETVLGPDGELLRLSIGSYGDLFPGGSAHAAENTVLALEILRGDTSKRLLVPGTGGPALERSASLVYESDSDTVYVAWSSLYRYAEINLVGRRDGQWSDVIEVSGNPYSFKSTPRVAVTRDELPATADAERRQRTILHTVWEEDGTGPFYAPLVLIDGEFQGPNRVHRLSRVVKTEVDPPADGFVTIEPIVVPGTDGESVTIAFTHESSGELVTLSVRPLPGALTEVADGADTFVRTSDLDACSGGGRKILANGLGDLVLELAEPLQESLRLYLAAQAEALVDPAAAEACEDHNDAGDVLVSVAEEARAHIILIGAREIGPGPLDGFTRRARAHIVLIGLMSEPLSNGPSALEGSVSHVASFAATSETSPPDRLFVSADGTHVITAWSGEGNRVRYREAIAGEGWAEPVELVVDRELTLNEAWQALDGRVHGR